MDAPRDVEMTDTGKQDALLKKETLELRRLLLSFFASFTALFAVVYAALRIFEAQVTAASEFFVEQFGGLGVALGYFVPDAFTLPLPNDAFSLIGRVGGMSFPAVVFWGTVGSLVGGSVGWLIGKHLIGRWARLQRYFDRVGSRMMARYQQGGAWILLAAALTPLPYSIACWGAGAIGMPYARFMLISCSRVFRVAGYLWLIEQGLGGFGP